MTAAEQLRAVIDVLDDAESYLSAMHDAVGRHDHIGANLTCGGCALNARLGPALAVARQLLGTGEQPEVETVDAQLLRCSLAVLQRPHDPHLWVPQPGMDPVHCTGQTTPAATEEATR